MKRYRSRSLVCVAGMALRFPCVDGVLVGTVHGHALASKDDW